MLKLELQYLNDLGENRLGNKLIICVFGKFIQHPAQYTAQNGQGSLFNAYLVWLGGDGDNQRTATSHLNAMHQ